MQRACGRAACMHPLESSRCAVVSLARRPPLTLPTSTDELGNATGYVGNLAHWGGWEGSQQMATEKDEPEIILRIDVRRAVNELSQMMPFPPY